MYSTVPETSGNSIIQRTLCSATQKVLFHQHRILPLNHTLSQFYFILITKSYFWSPSSTSLFCSEGRWNLTLSLIHSVCTFETELKKNSADYSMLLLLVTRYGLQNLLASACKARVNIFDQSNPQGGFSALPQIERQCRWSSKGPII